MSVCYFAAMRFLVRNLSACLFAALIFSTLGCDRVATSPADEEKDPHYLQGLNRMKSFDHRGAIESFERALESNPRSASAHYRLGLLYEEKEADPASAIYHYSRFLKLRPDSEESRNIEPRISGCKMDLAKSISFAPQVSSMQRDIERLNGENMELKRRIETLQAQLSRPAEHVPREATNRPSQVQITNAVRSDVRQPAPRATNNLARESPRATRRHLVKSRETVAGIARQNGITTEALLRANPGLNPMRLRPGQTLVIPAS